MTAITYTVPKTEDARIAGKTLTGGYPVTRDGTEIVRFSQEIKGQRICLKIEGRPELAALVADYRAAQAEQQAENEARWARERAEQEAADAPLLAAMRAEVERLVSLIPDGAIRVSITQVGNADGSPILRYEAEGVELAWEQITHVGNAQAIRPGATGAFAWEMVAYIAAADLAAIREQHAAKSEEQAAKAEATARDLRETPVPAPALAAHQRYHGDADRAWEAGDEAAWAAIRKWEPYIKAQGL